MDPREWKLLGCSNRVLGPLKSLLVAGLLAEHAQSLTVLGKKWASVLKKPLAQLAHVDAQFYKYLPVLRKIMLPSTNF